jgi:hypothetical protein
MTIDPNFDNVTLAVFTLSGRLVKLKRFKTPHRKILTHRIWIERIQGGTQGRGDSSRILEELLRVMARELGVSHGNTPIKWGT